MRKMMFIVLVMTLTGLFTGCRGTADLKTGTYHLDGNPELFTYVLLEEGGRFEFSRGLALSYRPMGFYEVEGDRLILKANENEEYEFLIDGEVLVYLEGLGEIIENGSRFLLGEARE